MAAYPFTAGFTLMWDWGGANGFDVDTGSTQKYIVYLSNQTVENTAVKYMYSFEGEGRRDKINVQNVNANISIPQILYEGRKKTPSESSDGATPTEESAESAAEATPVEEGEKMHSIFKWSSMPLIQTGWGTLHVHVRAHVRARVVHVTWLCVYLYIVLLPPCYLALSDEEKVLEQMIKDTEEATIDEEVGVDPEEEGSGSGAEPGASALLDEFIMRYVMLPVLHSWATVD